MRYYTADMQSHFDLLWLFPNPIQSNYIGDNWMSIINDDQIGLLNFIVNEVYNQQFITRDLAQARINSIIRQLNNL